MNGPSEIELSRLCKSTINPEVLVLAKLCRPTMYLIPTNMQPKVMSLFWKEIDKTQMSKPPECAATFFWTWKSTLVGHLRLQKYIKSRWNTLYGKMGNCDTLPEKKSRDKHTFSIFHMLVHSIARANLNKNEKFLKTTTAA